MAAPTKYPEWASGAGTDAISGQANVLEPPDALKTGGGFAYRMKVPRNWLNWLFYTIYTWILWLATRARLEVIPAVNAFIADATKAEMTFSGTPPVAYIIASSGVGGLANVLVPIHVSVGEQITRIYGYVKDGQGTWTMQAVKQNLGTGAVTTLGAADTSAADTAYETLDSGALTETVAAGFSYHVQFLGNSNTNAGQQLLAVGVQIGAP